MIELRSASRWRREPSLQLYRSFHFFCSSNLSINTSSMKNPQHFHFLELPKNFAQDFPLHPHNFCDILKFSWIHSPIRMTIYSTKALFLSDREFCKKESQCKRYQMDSIEYGVISNPDNYYTQVIATRTKWKVCGAFRNG